MPEYAMCCQRVTLYRKTPQGILRQEIPNCYLQVLSERVYGKLSCGQDLKFLLIQPGQEQLVFPGDRVFDGIGPEITQEQWDTWAVPMGEVDYAVPYQWQGVFCHTEAGRK